MLNIVFKIKNIACNWTNYFRIFKIHNNSHIFKMHWYIYILENSLNIKLLSITIIFLKIAFMNK
jgi:hypothetical protein